MTDDVEQQIDKAFRTEATSLRIERSDLTSLPDTIGRLRHLRSLTLSENSLSSLPGSLANLANLEELDLAENPLVAFPEALLGLEKLRSLGLSKTQISEIPSGIGRLTNLQFLMLPGNKIGEIPTSIGRLSNLRVLDLGSNNIQDLPESLGGLNSLTELYLWGNRFSHVPIQLRPLSKLEVLDLSSGGTMSQSAKSQDGWANTETVFAMRLVGVESIYDERIAEVPKWVSELLALRGLYLGGNRIQQIPESFARSHLTSLFLAKNHFSDFPAAVVNMTTLLQLDLSSNQIEVLPETISRLTMLKYFDLQQNPLPIPPEILSRPDEPSGIFSFVAHAREGSRPLNEAKLLVLGEGSVGKTSLIRRLVDSTFDSDERKTEGIAVKKWILNVDESAITLNVWDFGGQEIMHATHQFFLTKRSIYILVIDARQGDDQNRVEYWLKLIQGFSDKSPVILIGNKAEGIKLDIDRRGLLRKYDNVVDILECSCAENTGIDAVKDHLHGILAGLPHVRDSVPESFFRVKAHLESLDANFLPYTDYLGLCQNEGIGDKISQERLVSFLHDLGTVLCFREDPRLAETNILNPEWVTGGVYRLLNSYLAAQRKGLLSAADVSEILTDDDYPEERRQFILDMMKKFELCFTSGEGAFYFVPDLLTKEEPDTGSWSNALHFEFHYDVLPSSLISRLIVRMHDLISKSTMWRTGVVLGVDNSRALVKADREDAVITISVIGPGGGRRALLTLIRSQLREIQNSIPGLSAAEQVPIPGRPDISVPYQHLLVLEEQGESSFIPQGMVDRIGVRELLDGIESRVDRRQAGLTEEVRESAPVPEPTEVAWSPSESMRLGWFLLAAFAVIVLCAVGAYWLLGGIGAGVIGGALGTLTVIGLFILRSGGRISEEGFRKALASRPNREVERDTEGE